MKETGGRGDSEGWFEEGGCPKSSEIESRVREIAARVR